MSKSSEAKPLPIEPISVRPKVASALIGVSPRKFAEMRACGLLPKGHKLNGCLVYLTKDLNLWAEWGFPCMDKFLALQKGEKK